MRRADTVVENGADKETVAIAVAPDYSREEASKAATKSVGRVNFTFGDEKDGSTIALKDAIAFDQHYHTTRLTSTQFDGSRGGGGGDTKDGRDKLDREALTRDRRPSSRSLLKSQAAVESDFIIPSSFGPKKRRTGMGGRGGSRRKGGTVASLSSSNILSAVSVAGVGVGVNSATHDPTHRRHWQKMSHTALSDTARRAPPVATGSASLRGRKQQAAPPSSSALVRADEKQSDGADLLASGSNGSGGASSAVRRGMSLNRRGSVDDTGVGGNGRGSPATARMGSFRMRRGLTGDGSDRDKDESEKSAKDVQLLKWLNLILFGPAGQHNTQQRPEGPRHLHSLLDLKELQMLAIAVRKISGADEDEKKAAAAANAIAQQQQEQRQQHGVRGRGRGSRRQEERGLSEGSAAGSGGVLGGANRNQSTFAMSAEPGGSRGSSSGEIMPREAGESSGSFEETNDGVLGALTGLGSAPFMAVDGARQADAYEAEDVLRSGRQAMSVGKTRGGSFRALLGSLPSSRKKAPSKASTVRRMKQDVTLLLSGRAVTDRDPIKLPGDLDSAVDRACTGGIGEVRELLTRLRHHQVLLALARAENGQGLRRRASSCDPAPRIMRSRSAAAVPDAQGHAFLAGSAAAAAAAAAGSTSQIIPISASKAPAFEVPRKPVIAPYATGVLAKAAAAASVIAITADTVPPTPANMAETGAAHGDRTTGNIEPRQRTSAPVVSPSSPAPTTGPAETSSPPGESHRRIVRRGRTSSKVSRSGSGNKVDAAMAAAAATAAAIDSPILSGGGASGTPPSSSFSRVPKRPPSASSVDVPVMQRQEQRQEEQQSAKVMAETAEVPSTIPERRSTPPHDSSVEEGSRPGPQAGVPSASSGEKLLATASKQTSAQRHRQLNSAPADEGGDEIWTKALSWRSRAAMIALAPSVPPTRAKLELLPTTGAATTTAQPPSASGLLRPPSTETNTEVEAEAAKVCRAGASTTLTGEPSSGVYGDGGQGGSKTFSHHASRVPLGSAASTADLEPRSTTVNPASVVQRASAPSSSLWAIPAVVSPSESGAGVSSTTAVSDAVPDAVDSAKGAMLERSQAASGGDHQEGASGGDSAVTSRPPSMKSSGRRLKARDDAHAVEKGTRAKPDRVEVTARRRQAPSLTASTRKAIPKDTAPSAIVIAITAANANAARKLAEQTEGVEGSRGSRSVGTAGVVSTAESSRGREDDKNVEGHAVRARRGSRRNAQEPGELNKSQIEHSSGGRQELRTKRDSGSRHGSKARHNNNPGMSRESTGGEDLRTGLGPGSRTESSRSKHPSKHAPKSKRRHHERGSSGRDGRRTRADGGRKDRGVPTDSDAAGVDRSEPSQSPLTSSSRSPSSSPLLSPDQASEADMIVTAAPVVSVAPRVISAVESHSEAESAPLSSTRILELSAVVEGATQTSELMPDPEQGQKQEHEPQQAVAPRPVEATDDMAPSYIADVNGHRCLDLRRWDTTAGEETTAVAPIAAATATTVPAALVAEAVMVGEAAAEAEETSTDAHTAAAAAGQTAAAMAAMAASVPKAQGSAPPAPLPRSSEGRRGGDGDREVESRVGHKTGFKAKKGSRSWESEEGAKELAEFVAQRNQEQEEERQATEAIAMSLQDKAEQTTERDPGDNDVDEDERDGQGRIGEEEETEAARTVVSGEGVEHPVAAAAATAVEATAVEATAVEATAVEVTAVEATAVEATAVVVTGIDHPLSGNTDEEAVEKSDDVEESRVGDSSGEGAAISGNGSSSISSSSTGRDADSEPRRVSSRMVIVSDNDDDEDEDDDDNYGKGHTHDNDATDNTRIVHEITFSPLQIAGEMGTLQRSARVANRNRAREADADSRTTPGTAAVTTTREDGVKEDDPTPDDATDGADFTTEADGWTLIPEAAVASAAAPAGAASTAFGIFCPESVRMVVEFIGSVEGVARASAVATSWRSAIAPHESQLYNIIVLRAGVSPHHRAAFWEHMILNKNHHATTVPSDPDPASSSAGRLSLAALAHQGSNSEWTRIIDDDVARTFGRPTSFRANFSESARQDPRRRHWWPQSLGGAPLEARAPISSTSSRAARQSVSGLESWDEVDPGAQSDEDNASSPPSTAEVAPATVDTLGGSTNSLIGESGGMGGVGGGGSNDSNSRIVETPSSYSSPRAVPIASGNGDAAPGEDVAQDHEDGDEYGGHGEDGRWEPSVQTLQRLDFMKRQLTDTLRALSVSFGRVGYCQGMDCVVAHLMKCLGTDGAEGFQSDPERVFVVVKELFNKYGLQHVYSENLEALKLMLAVFKLLIEKRLPLLNQHFEAQELDIRNFAVSWFQTLFLYTARMPPDTLLWLWDVWVTEQSYKIFFQAALAILKMSELKLLELDFEPMMKYLTDFPEDAAMVLEKDVLVPATMSIKITDSMLRGAQRKLKLLAEQDGDGLDWTRRTDGSERERPSRTQEEEEQQERQQSEGAAHPARKTTEGKTRENGTQGTERGGGGSDERGVPESDHHSGSTADAAASILGESPLIFGAHSRGPSMVCVGSMGLHPGAEGVDNGPSVLAGAAATLSGHGGSPRPNEPDERTDRGVSDRSLSASAGTHSVGAGVGGDVDGNARGRGEDGDYSSGGAGNKQGLRVAAAAASAAGASVPTSACDAAKTTPASVIATDTASGRDWPVGGGRSSDSGSGGGSGGGSGSGNRSGSPISRHSAAAINAASQGVSPSKMPAKMPSSFFARSPPAVAERMNQAFSPLAGGAGEGKEGDRCASESSDDGDCDTSCPPQMEPLARATEVSTVTCGRRKISGRSREQTHRSGGGSAGGVIQHRYVTPVASTGTPPQPMLGGKDEYAFVAAGDE